MKIYLVRHGEYVLNDLQKPGSLSENGVAQIKKLADFIHPLDLYVSNILHSGKPRALETSLLLAKGFRSDEPPQIFSGLLPEDQVDPIVNDVRNWGSDVLLVGHLPFMSRFLSRLVVNDETKEIVTFHTGTMVCVQGEAISNWSIQWVLNPALLDASHP